MQFEIKNSEASPTAEILIYDKIGRSGIPASGVGAKEFAEAFQKIPATKPITVRINSPGGNVSDGLAIHNLLESRKANVTTIVDGYALSAASIIALAGSQMRMPKNALFMIHDPHASAEGTSEDMRLAAEMLDKHRDSLAGIYQKKSRMPREEINRLMSAETWYTGEEAKAAGFADVVTDDQPANASFDLSKFKHPTAIKVDSKPHIEMNVADFKTLVAQTLGLNSADVAQKPTIAEAELVQARATIAQMREEIAQIKEAAITRAKELSDSHSSAIAAAIEAEREKHKKELDAKEAEVERRAHAKAGEIARLQGVTPVKEESAAAAKMTGTDVLAQMNAITDPIARTRFYREHKAAIDAAYASSIRN